ncbi:hypothetical protein NUH88_20305 [Nisaea acidiphila]|uniref:Uncharacterized protein n=1 Tax=Nisaea acidiphila TaxID=1862145 RepID=A0A9J7AR57_9PROT|nr:hypothetical protein [Nisaea acidiphila]UUX49727.1 hypothetical protein NUH88_20305 [Nisaea acidiphila]
MSTLADAGDINLGDIDGQLFRIPEADLTHLVAELERRSMDRKKAPAIAKILEKLRPRLAIVKPERQATLVRFFAEPFSDLLYNTGEPRKPVGRIPRSTIVPCYRLFQEYADAARVARYQEDLESIDKDNDAALLELGTGFWRYASGRIREALTAADRDRNVKASIIEKLGDETVYAALMEMAGVLEVAVPVMELRQALPSTGLKSVTNTDLEHICTALNTVHRQRPANTEFIVFVILARLQNPSMIVDIMQRAEEAGTVADVSGITNIANEAIVSQTEEKIRGLQEKINSAESGQDLALQTEKFVKDVLGAARAVGSSGSRMQARQVQRTKTEMADLVRREMLEALDGQVATDLFAMSQPNGDRDPVEAQKSVEDRIVSLRITDRFADELGLDRDVNQRLAQLEHNIGAQSEALLNTIRSRNFSAVDPDEAERQLFSQVRMTELLLGPEKANQLRLEGTRLLNET